MNYWKNSVGLWQNKSITVKHGAGIGLLVFLILIIASTGIFSLHLVQRADDEIRIITSIQRLILEIDREMEQARHMHANFFLYYPKIGIHKAHENYAQPSIRKIAGVVSKSHALRDLISHSEISDAFRNSKIDLNLYLSSAKRFADTSIESFELVTRLATPDSGLEDLLNKKITELKTATAQIRELYEDTHDMEALIYQYRIKRKRYLMQSAFNISFNLQNSIDTASFLNSEQKGKITFIINRIHEIANQILEIDVALDSKFNDFVLQDKATHSVSAKLIALAKKEAAKAQQKISRTQHMTLLFLIVVTLLGMAAAGAIANILNRNITRRIIQLTRVTNKMRKGRLNVRADEESLDELGVLGKTFNFMAARMKDLVDNLEQEVDDRTLDLSEANKNLKMEIRERKQAETIITQKKAFLNRIIDQSPFATWISDAHGTIERVNTALKNILNVTDDEQVAGKYNVLQDPNLKRQNLIPLIQTVFEKGETIHFTCDWDGFDFPTINYKDTNTVTIEATMFPVFNSQGELINVVLNGIDITEKKQMETAKQLLEQQLRQSQKMEAIGTLTGGIAHDFNNILGIMLGNTELALIDTPELSPARVRLERINTAGLRAKEVVRQLLNYTRKIQKDQTPQDLKKLVKDSLKLLRSSIPSRIQIIEDISETRQFVRADETQIHQLIINLATNAVHAMEEKGGILGIHLDSFCLEKKSGGKYKKLSPGEYVELCISDTGTGMKPEIIEKIFDPYYTTKEFGKGAGMGLAIVHGIIKSHDASIHVESHPGKGSSFSIFFPKLQKKAEKKISKQIEKTPLGTERILFVDDDKAIVEMMSIILSQLGYQVTGETDPVKTVAKFAANPDDFDLVISDMTMPQMDGEELFKKLQEIRPGIPIIICTGHSATLDNKRARDMGISALIMKPVSMAEIAKKIREILGNRKPVL